MKIDEERKYCLTKYASKTGKQSVKESDHNTLFLEIELPEEHKEVEASKRETIFNFDDKEGFQRFLRLTSNNFLLESCFSNDGESIEHQSKRWLRLFKNILNQSFKKVRLKPPKQSNIMKKEMKRDC